METAMESRNGQEKKNIELDLRVSNAGDEQISLGPGPPWV